MIAVVLVAACLTLVAIFGLEGRAQRDDGPRLSEMAMSMVSVLAVTGAATMAVGFTITALVVFLVSAVVALLAPVLAGSPVGSRLVRLAPLSTGLGWVATLAVLLGLTGMALAWICNVIATLTRLNSHVVAVFIVIAAIVAGIGGRGRLGQSRIGVGVAVASAVVLMAAGFVVGAPAGLGDPGVTVGKPGAFGLVVYPICLVIASAAHPGLRAAAVSRRRTYVLGVVMMAVLTSLGLLGLLMLVGGAFSVPSIQLDTFVAYIPAAAGAVIAGLFTLIGATTAAQAVNVALDASRDLGPEVPIPVRGVLGRTGATLLLGVGLAAVAITQPDPRWMVPSLAAIAVIGLLGERRARRHAADVQHAVATSSDARPAMMGAASDRP